MHKVLLVDDNVALAQSLRVILETKLPGIRVEVVDGVAGARASLASWTPDVAVLDVHLRDGNGIALCKEMATSHPRLRFVMMSAEPLSASSVVGDSVVGVLSKPFAPEELIRLVRGAFAHEPANDLPQLETLPISTPACPTQLKQQLIQVLAGLYDVRQSLRSASLREAEVHSIVDDKLVPLIDVVSDISRDINGRGGSKP
jgi:DNA-binding NtrC family response regulator